MVMDRWAGGSDVDERSRVLVAACVGAVVGGVCGWLYLTESGRYVREQLEPRLDDLIGEMTRVRGTVEKARTAANEGWRSLSDITGGQGGRWSA
jgi:hypothetical protein